MHKKDTKEFTREAALKNEDKALKAVYEKALLYYDAKELPQNWDKEDLLGTETDSEDDDDQVNTMMQEYWLPAQNNNH